MKESLLAMLLLAAASGSWAQQEVTRLQCDGTFSNYLQNALEVPNQGGYVEIRKHSVKLVSIYGFDGDYEILNSNEAKVYFGLADDRLLLGNLNRFSGELSVNRQRAKPIGGDFGGFEKVWRGKCRPAKPMF